MAHELVDARSMVYVGETPWHGLGVKVEAGMTPDEFLTAANLNWDVEIRNFPSIPGMNDIRDHRMLVRPAVYEGEYKETCLDVVGKRFKPIQNSEAAALFSEYVEAGQMEMETAGALRNGEYVWFLAKTTDAFSLADGDEVRGYFLLVSPHKAGQAFVAKLTATRVVCMNTMTYALNQDALGRGEWRMRHSRKLDADAIEDMKVTLGIKSAMETYREQAEFLSNTKFSDRDNVVYLARVLAPNLLDGDKLKVMVDGREIRFDIPANVNDVANIPSELIHGRNPFKRAAKVFETQPGYEMKSSLGKAWGALNCITFATDHVFGSSTDSRMFNSVMGPTVNLKNRAMNIALEMAKAA